MHQPSGFRRVIRDIADLCELQIELLAADGKEATRRSGSAAVCVLIAAILGLATVALFLLGFAFLLHEQAGLAMSVSLFIVGGVAALCGVIGAAIGWTLVKQAIAALDETRSEFAENLRWIKAAVISPETSPRAQVNENSFNDRFASAGPTYPR